MQDISLKPGSTSAAQNGSGFSSARPWDVSSASLATDASAPTHSPADAVADPQAMLASGGSSPQDGSPCTEQRTALLSHWVDDAPATLRGARVGPTHDDYEQQADLAASAVQQDPRAFPPKTESAARPASAKHAAVAGGRLLDAETAARLAAHVGDVAYDVDIHTDGAAAKLTHGIGAQAVTHCQSIFFAQGRFAPETQEGFSLLVHEATHARQQREAPAAAGTLQRKPAPGASYELGNRPNPVLQQSAIYRIKSSSPRIVQTGTTVKFEIDQYQQAYEPLGATHQARWFVEPPFTVKQSDSGWSWNARFLQPGVVTICCEVASGQTKDLLKYQQQVEPRGLSHAKSGANVKGTPIKTIDDFIAVVQRVEAAYPGAPWQDIATRIRKEFYPGPSGAYGGIKAAFTWDDMIDEQEDIPPLDSGRVAMEDIVGLRKAQQSLLGLDIGHVMTGIDAMNFPGTAGIPRMHGVSGPAASTWSGDVGSALTNWANQATLNDQSDQTKEKFYKDYASLDDLIGDIDGINIATMGGLPENAPLSARLRRYYKGEGTSQPTASRRYHSFCEKSGFSLAGNKLDASARAYIQDQVLRFAKAFNISGSVTDALILYGEQNPFTINETLKMTTASRINDNVQWFSERFVTELESRLSSEKNQ